MENEREESSKDQLNNKKKAPKNYQREKQQQLRRNNLTSAFSRQSKTIFKNKKVAPVVQHKAKEPVVV